jgi:ribosomal protein S24E
MENQRVEQCRDDYRRTSGYNVFKQRTQLYPIGWSDVVTRYAHAQLWPLNTQMTTSQMVRFMLMEQTYTLSGKWLDAAGNNAVDNCATESYNNIINMLRWGMKTVFVNDVEQVMGRGRKSQGSTQVYQDRDVVFDNMSLEEVKQLVRVALHDWEAEQTLGSRTDTHTAYGSG